MPIHVVQYVGFQRVQDGRYERPTYFAKLLVDATVVVMDAPHKRAQNAIDEGKAMAAEYNGQDDDYVAVLLRATDHPDLVSKDTVSTEPQPPASDNS